MNLRVKRLDDTAILPRRASGGAPCERRKTNLDVS